MNIIYIYIKRMIFLPFAFSFLLTACSNTDAVKTNEPAEIYIYTNSGISGVYPDHSPVAIHGKLKVIGTQLCDEKGDPVQLRGLSTHGVQWFGQFVNKEGIDWLAKNWKMDVFRVALYTVEQGFMMDPSLVSYVKYAVEYAEESGIYCVIDWHVLNDRDPNLYKKYAKDFFKKMSFLYGAKKHVIYEICNEPNGKSVTWESKIKPYAEYIIPVIRSGDSNAVIIVGTGTWSQDVQDAAADPLKFDNVLYTVHFYAGTHTQRLRDRVNQASSKIPIFCTEWGTSDSSGNNGPFLEESKLWMDFLNSKKISWCNWSFSDKQEVSAFLKPSTRASGGWSDDNLSLSGRFVRDQMTNR